MVATINQKITPGLGFQWFSLYNGTKTTNLKAFNSRTNVFLLFYLFLANVDTLL